MPLTDLATAVADAPPSLVLDYLWGPVAEATFAALGATRADDVAYVQIGSLAGADASLPAALLRSRRIRITGSGAGAVTKERMLAETPRVLERLADGSLTVPYTAFPLSRVAEAWAHEGSTRAVVVPD